MRLRLTSRRLAAVAAGAFGLALLVLGSLAVVRYVPLLRDGLALRDDLRSLIRTARESGIEMAPRQLELISNDVRQAVARHERIASTLASDPLIAVARALPFVGTQVSAGDELMAASGLLLGVVSDGIGIGQDVIEIRDGPGGSRLESATGLLADSRPVLRSSLAALDEAETRLRGIPDDAIDLLRGARDEALDNLAAYRPLLADAMTASEVIPALLGEGGQVRYLVLSQNPAELRPTGGYIGSFGILAFDRGRVAAMEFRDVSSVDGLPGLPYVEPPGPLRDHLLGDQPWRLADSNWSPDGSIAAQEAVRMYESQTGDRVDGAILITTQAVDELLELTGPVSVPPDGIVVEPGRSTFVVTAATREADTGEDRKAFIGRFAEVLMDELLTLPASRWPEVPSRLDAIREARSASLWVRDAGLQERIVALGWSGSTTIDGGDEVRIVEANVGPVSKLHLVTERRVELDVELTSDGLAYHVLSVSWTNRIRDPDPEIIPIASMLLDYQDRDTLGVYVRTLVPIGSALTESAIWGKARVGGLEAQGTELGRTSFGSYVLVPPGTSGLRLGWVSSTGLEPTATGWRYRLRVPKHPGRLADELDLTIRLPPGMRIAGPLPSLPDLEVRESDAALRITGRSVADLELELNLAATS